MSFFADKIQPKKYEDYWITIGLPKYLSNFFVYISEEKNYYNYMLLKDIERLTSMVSNGEELFPLNDPKFSHPCEMLFNEAF